MNVANLKAKQAFKLRRNWRAMEAASSNNALSLEQASDYIGVSEAAMRSWKRGGKGPAFFRAGKLLKFRKSDLDAWIEARLVKPEQKQ
jgi:excisionase family DNA binding protein